MKVPGTGLLKILLIVMLALLFAPLVVSQIGLQAGTAVDSATIAVEAIAPKLAALSLVVVGIALTAGVILHAFGHAHGNHDQEQPDGGGGRDRRRRLLRLAERQGPTIATDLVANVGTMIRNAAARL